MAVPLPDVDSMKWFKLAEIWLPEAKRQSLLSSPYMVFSLLSKAALGEVFSVKMYSSHHNSKSGAAIEKKPS